MTLPASITKLSGLAGCLFFFAILPASAQTSSTPATTGTAEVSKTDVNVAFTGVTKFRESELKNALADQIQDIRDYGLNPASADDAAFFLSLFYHNHGYSQTDVREDIKGNVLTLNVNEGPLTTIANITFSGNTSIPNQTLRDYLVGATKERYSMLKKNVPFIAGDIETGVERIRGLYQSEGFLDSTVDPAQIAFSKDKTEASIKVTVHEGQQYHFGKLVFAGDLVFRPPTVLENELKPFYEKPYTQTGVSNMQRKLVYFYRARGYFDVKVLAESDPAKAMKGKVPVTFTIQSGNVYRFGKVNVTGLDRLNPGFLPKRFSKLHNKFYDPAKLDEIYREMMRTGLFKSLRITSTPVNSNEVELNMDVEEAKSKEIGFSVGYGTFDGPILGLRLGDRDMFGYGRPVSLAFELSARLLKGELTYTDPWFLDTPNTLKLRLYTLNQDWDGYSKVEAGFRAELSRKITKNLEATLFLVTRQDNIKDEGITPTDLGDTDYMINSVGLSLTLDLREKTKNASRPGRGFVGKMTGEFATTAVGSTISYARGTASASYYIPIKNTLLAFGARGGIVSPTEDDLPIDERFFNGGSQTVRSFAERELGPKDIHGYPIGGETFTVFNAEYTFPLYGDLDGAVFFDAGSVGRYISDGIGDMRYGIGAGLRYRLPIGPLRLDYGYNPSPKNGEAVGAFHLSFGFAF